MSIKFRHFGTKNLKNQNKLAKYLGVADKKGGEYKNPEKRITATLEKSIVDFGDSMLLAALLKTVGCLLLSRIALVI